MHRQSIQMGVLLSTAYLFTCVSVVRAQPAGAPPPEPGVVQVGFEQRVRTEDWNNIMDYSNKTDDEREQIRYRTKLWATIPVRSNIIVNVGLTQETNQIMNRVNQFDEVVFDTANIEFKRLFNQNISFKVGRQMLMRGEGFMVFDGNAGDGSRTQYYNAAVLGWDFWNSRLEAMAIDDPSRDRFLPVIHNRYKNLQDWDEQALGLYYTDKNFTSTKFETYYFYKKEIRDLLAPTNPQFQPDRHIHTAGGRVVQQITPNWSVTGEFAKQWGAQHGNKNISAWGGYGYVKRTFDRSWKPYVQSGYWALSGDDPKTNTFEGFDPIFSRWPKWSDLYVYSQVKETAVAYWTNLGMWQAEAGFRPLPRVQCKMDYYHMSAFHTFPGSQSYFGDGLTRGNLLLLLAEFKLNDHWKAHALWEGLGPGDFYRSQDRGYFVRFEVAYQFNTNLPVSKWAKSNSKTNDVAKAARPIS